MYKSNWPIFSDTMINNVSNILKSGKVNQWTGTKVFDFEKKFSEYFGINHSIAVFNGTVALELCLKTLNIGKGDDVIVTARTFIASASCINTCGATPIFIDVDKDTQNITLENIKQKVTSNTKAVILVHLAGWPCDVEEITDWCHSNNIFVIEDCAQAHGAKYKNKFVGTFGDINAWSFCQDKIITTAGEGGMVTTNSKELFLKAWSYKDHGKNYEKMFNKTDNISGLFKWVHDSIGTNWRMTEIQASVGIDALNKLEEWILIRRKNAQIFNDTFKDLDLIRLTIPSEKYYHSYYKYYCFINKDKIKDGFCRNDIIKEINKLEIPCFQGTCGEVYLEKAYDQDHKLPVTKELSETSLMFLVDPTYTIEKITQISNIVKNIFLEYTKN